MDDHDNSVQGLMETFPSLVLGMYQFLQLRPLVYLPAATVIFISCFAIWYLFHLSSFLHRVPDSLPWVGVGDNQLLPRIRACFRQNFVGFDDVKEGSEKYAKSGRSFVLPQPNFRPVVIIPKEHMRWLIKQPDRILSARDALSDSTGLLEMIPRLTTPHEFRLGGFIINTFRFNSPRKVDQDTDSLLADIGEILDDVLGLDETEWKEIHVLKTMAGVTSRPVARMVLGRAMCHDEKFSAQSEIFGLLLGTFSVVVGNYAPPVVREVVGYLLGIILSFHFDRIVRRILPMVKERSELLRGVEEKGPLPDGIPDDFMTWTIRAALAGKYAGFDNPHRVAGAIATIGLGATPTSTVIGSQLILDLCSSSPINLETIHVEARHALKSYAADPTVPLSSLLPHIDSALRESLRLHPLFIPNPCVKVMAEEGVTLPTGEHLPQYSLIGTPTFLVHHDPDVYPAPESYRPFRFVRPKSGCGDNPGPLGVETDLAATTVSEAFVGFGAGRHTCPGRWIAALSLKLTLAYIAAHYELKPLGSRPQSMRVGLAEVPPLGAKIWVRRRKGEGKI